MALESRPHRFPLYFVWTSLQTRPTLTSIFGTAFHAPTAHPMMHEMAASLRVAARPVRGAMILARHFSAGTVSVA